MSAANGYNQINHPHMLQQNQMVQNPMGLGGNINYQYDMLSMPNGAATPTPGPVTDSATSLQAMNAAASAASGADIGILQQLQNTISNLEARLNAQSDLVSGLSAATPTPNMGHQRTPRDNKLTVSKSLILIALRKLTMM
jgi:hypothetical protein